MTSYITPRPQPILAGTTSRCIRHSLSRSVAGSRTLSISACRSAFDQQSVATTPGGHGDVGLAVDDLQIPARLGEGGREVLGTPAPTAPGPAGATAPCSVATSSVALRKNFETQPIVNLPFSTPPSKSLPSKYDAPEPERGRRPGLEHDRHRPAARRGGEGAVEGAGRRLGVDILLSRQRELARPRREHRALLDARHLQVRVVAVPREDRDAEQPGDRRRDRARGAASARPRCAGSSAAGGPGTGRPAAS